MKKHPLPLPPSDHHPSPVDAALEFWERVGNVAEIWWARHGGLPVADMASQRLQALVAHARSASPFYKRHYAGLAASPRLGELPPVCKADLMGQFEASCTDPRIRSEDVERFLSDRTRIGATFLGKYYVWKSSGTSGTPGIFLQDRHAMAVYDALVATHFDADALESSGATRIAAGAGRAGLVIATGDHYAGIASWEHLRRAFPAPARRSFSVLDALPSLVAGLNEFKPAFLSSYPSALALLAAERVAGRLHIAPALLWSAGETLAPSAKEAIESAFGCRVMNEYGSSECLAIAHECRAGWMHVNSEWVILEGVDADGSRTPPGELSYSTLLTNLANWIQPIIRYDLGDRMMTLPVPCACGNPMPAVRVEGRRDAMLALRTREGRTVHLLPMALTTVVEEAAGEHRFQIAQSAPDHLVIRMEGEGAPRERTARWKRAQGALRAYLSKQSLANVRLTLDRAAPRVDPRSGKLHAVVVEKGPR